MTNHVYRTGYHVKYIRPQLNQPLFNIYIPARTSNLYNKDDKLCYGIKWKKKIPHCQSNSKIH